MEWFFDTLRKYPELAIFLTLGLGYWIGAKKIFGFNLGAVTGTLLVGVLVGQLKLRQAAGQLQMQDIHGLNQLIARP